jgi:transposase-like protein
MTKYYTDEFKEQIVEAYRQGRSAADLGREFNLAATSVSNWVRAADRRDAKKSRPGPAPKKPAVETPEAKIARLEAELARKDRDLKILGKALAFFVRRSDR